jgi:protein-S-isoprenylcysteine O-methyltransferase Ste14
MKASAILFRFRTLFLTVIMCTGFWAPWIEILHIGSRIPLLEWLALEISRLGLLRFTVATPVVIVCGALVAAMGVLFRVWGSAWLGHTVVLNAEMKGASLMADGPYRYVRNPLYLGVCCMIAALALLMPATGGLFAFIAVPVFLFILILGEEAFLVTKIGEPYRVYLRSVPRMFPRLRATLTPTGNKPHWLQAVLSEINPIGVFITIAFLSWTYNNLLMLKAIVVTFGLSLIARALMPRFPRQSTEQPQPAASQ